MRSATEIIEAYLHGLRSGDLSAVPLDPNVAYEGPPAPRKLVGKEVTDFLAGLLPSIRDLRVDRHIVEGPYVATMLEIDIASGTIPAFVCFRFSNGFIKEIRPFYDSRLVPSREGQIDPLRHDPQEGVRDG